MVWLVCFCGHPDLLDRGLSFTKHRSRMLRRPLFTNMWDGRAPGRIIGKNNRQNGLAHLECGLPFWQASSQNGLSPPRCRMTAASRLWGTVGVCGSASVREDNCNPSSLETQSKPADRNQQMNIQRSERFSHLRGKMHKNIANSGENAVSRMSELQSAGDAAGDCQN